MEEASRVLDDMGHSVEESIMNWFYAEKCWARESNIQLMYLASYWMGYSSFQDGELLLRYLNYFAAKCFILFYVVF
jgi:hypothetical protein